MKMDYYSDTEEIKTEGVVAENADSEYVKTEELVSERYGTPEPVSEQPQRSKTEEYAEQLLKSGAEAIIENMRFMKEPLDRINMYSKRGIDSTAMDGDDFYYEPTVLLRKCVADDNYPVRSLLHSLAHAIFAHPLKADRVNDVYWDLACDITVENLITELSIPGFTLRIDDEIRYYTQELKDTPIDMTAEKLYRYFLANPPSMGKMSEYSRLFCRDDHSFWKNPQNLDVDHEEWKRITERIKIELKVFAKTIGHAESLLKNLEEATKQRYDYKKLLERFCLDNDSIVVSGDEFDYVYYTFGLTTYDGMPFIEPLELTKERAVRDYVITLDVSKTCPAEAVHVFLKKTYEMIKYLDSFAREIYFHILRCDGEEIGYCLVRNETELGEFLKDFSINESPGGDYKSAYVYVDKLLRERVFNDFRGMIYFTDRYGEFPGKNPEYECIFAYIPGIPKIPTVPWWATPIELDENSF